MEKIKINWTEDYIQGLNERLKAVGMPQFIIDNGYVYKDELHKILGIGIKLEDSKK